MKERPILKSKLYLYLTEFFAGVSVMAVELGASRLLAPYFSSSQIVWTIIIGTIMIAMALGNLWGGRAADKNPDPDRLYRRILVSAVWIAAIPAVGKYVVLGVSGLMILTVSTGFLVAAAFVSCFVIFVYPLFLLGTVTPSLVKYAVDSLDDSGSTVGRLGAANTVGSILGTFLPTFVTIPAVGTSVTFLIFSGVLLAIGLIYFFSGKTGVKACVLSIVLFIACGVLGRGDSFAFWDGTLSYEGESVYNYLQVKELPDRTILSTNVLFGVQSVKMNSDGLTGMYYDYALAAPAAAGLAKKDGSVLILGHGTGTFAAQCGRYFPRASVTGVEIDEKITSLAQEYFSLPESEDVVTYDGRAFLQASREKYDVIMVDAYQDITIPFQMSSREFFTLVREHLAPGGVLVVNMSMHSDGEGSINQALSDTVSAVFGRAWTADVPGTTNRELFACAGGDDFSETLQSSLESIGDPELEALMTGAAAELSAYSPGGMLLTDDKAPVEVLGMRMLDGYIGGEIAYYRDIFRTGGISGLLEELN